MTTLLSASKLTKSFGINPLFTDLSFVCEENERVAVVGANGAGKSTFLAMLAGSQEPDEGSVSRKRNLTVSYVPQEEFFNDEQSIREILEKSASLYPGNKEGVIRETLGFFGFDNPEEKSGVLSGGWKKRLSIACGLVTEPDLLLLDEPTNHLDVDGILLLEDLLTEKSISTLFISHDRYFIEHVATRIIEIDRRYPNGVLNVPATNDRGSYQTFLEAREEFLENLRLREASLKNKMRREAEWLSRMPKARGTKAKYRIDAAHALKKEIASIELDEKRVGLSFSGSGRDTKELIQLKDVSKSFGDKVLLKKFSLLISRKGRVGILGANGIGKTTLIRLLNGTLEADSGVIRRASSLKVATLDQTRDALDPDLTLAKALCREGDAVVFNGKSVHVASWAKRFAFKSEQLTQKISSLSGGERARVCLAQIMIQEVDLLILDEPTNDLDINTLEILEESIEEFPGAVILVTHDRYLLDRACNVIVGFLGDGEVEKFSDHYQWLGARAEKEKVEVSAVVQKQETRTPKQKSGKLSYKDERDWSTILERIDAQEKEVEKLQSAIDSNDIGQVLQDKCEALANAQKKLEELILRWEELEKLKGV